MLSFVRQVLTICVRRVGLPLIRTAIRRLLGMKGQICFSVFSALFPNTRNQTSKSYLEKANSREELKWRITQILRRWRFRMRCRVIPEWRVQRCAAALLTGEASENDFDQMNLPIELEIVENDEDWDDDALEKLWISRIQKKARKWGFSSTAASKNPARACFYDLRHEMVCEAERLDPWNYAMNHKWVFALAVKKYGSDFALFTVGDERAETSAPFSTHEVSAARRLVLKRLGRQLKRNRLPLAAVG